MFSQWHKTLFNYMSYLSIFFIIVTYTGLFYINPKYITTVHDYILYYVCAILLIRFNPYVKEDYENQSNVDFATQSNVVFDRKIAFTAGIILLTSIVGQHLSIR